jgi:histidinol phosphatase-like enzyme (inositol monophosphatase family)
MQSRHDTYENSFALQHDVEQPLIENLIAFIERLAAESGRAILPLFRTGVGVDVKPGKDWDPVTEADRRAEEVIRNLIEIEFPDHAILGEEFGPKTTNSEYQWIIDPIDGTRAFVAGMPTWATLIGLYRKGAPLIGIMHQPYVGEHFLGSPSGTWHCRSGERRRLQVAHEAKLADAKIGTTSPHLFDGVHAAGFDRLRQATKMTRYGCDAYSYCLLAAGQLDIAMDPLLQVYDIAALLPVLWGSGAVVTCWDGKNPAEGGNIVAAANEELLQQAVNLLAIKP